ncbi:MAG: hypothetical protein ABJP70_10775 [Erythrobacter sp.]
MAGRIRTIALVGCAGLALTGCAANPGPVIDNSTQKLISYFDAKQDLANTLQMQLGGPTATSPRNEYYSYRLVAINGPAYQLGSVLAVNNSLDLVTRKCVLDENILPFERWSTMPRWSSNSNLNTDLGVPAPLQGVFNKTSVDAGLKFDSASIYQIEDIGQRFLARDEMVAFTTEGECGEYLSSLTEPVVFVRGIIYGRETLKSAKGFGVGLNVRIVEEESGQFNFKYDSSGAYELSDTDIVPKFAVMAKIVPQPRAILAGATVRPTGGDFSAGEPKVETTTVVPADDDIDFAVLEEIEPAAGPRGEDVTPPRRNQLRANYGVAPLSDDEVKVIESGTPEE